MLNIMNNLKDSEQILNRQKTNQPNLKQMKKPSPGAGEASRETEKQACKKPLPGEGEGPQNLKTKTTACHDEKTGPQKPP